MRRRGPVICERVRGDSTWGGRGEERRGVGRSGEKCCGVGGIRRSGKESEVTDVAGVADGDGAVDVGDEVGDVMAMMAMMMMMLMAWGDVGNQLRWVIIACSYSVARSAGRRGPEDLSCSRATEICAAAKKPARPLIQSTQLRPRAPATTWSGWKLAPLYRTG